MTFKAKKKCCCTSPESTGGCCLQDGNCVVASEEACDEVEGIYLGDDTTCSGNPCQGECPNNAHCEANCPSSIFVQVSATASWPAIPACSSNTCAVSCAAEHSQIATLSGCSYRAGSSFDVIGDCEPAWTGSGAAPLRINGVALTSFGGCNVGQGKWVVFGPVSYACVVGSTNSSGNCLAGCVNDSPIKAANPAGAVGIATPTSCHPGGGASKSVGPSTDSCNQPGSPDGYVNVQAQVSLS